MDGDQVLETVITDVSPREVTRKADGETIKLYDITTEDGTFTTKIRPIATEAYNLKGRKAKLKVRITKNGDFTNRYLQQVVGEVFAPTDPSVMEKLGQETAFDADMAQQSSDKQTLIHRQTATKVAAWRVQPGDGPFAFWDYVNELMAYYETGQQPSDMSDKEVAEADDIPF